MRFIPPIQKGGSGSVYFQDVYYYDLRHTSNDAEIYTFDEIRQSAGMDVLLAIGVNANYGTDYTTGACQLNIPENGGGSQTAVTYTAGSSDLFSFSGNTIVVGLETTEVEIHAVGYKKTDQLPPTPPPPEPPVPQTTTGVFFSKDNETKTYGPADIITEAGVIMAYGIRLIIADEFRNQVIIVNFMLTQDGQLITGDYDITEPTRDHSWITFNSNANGETESFTLTRWAQIDYTMYGL